MYEVIEFPKPTTANDASWPPTAPRLIHSAELTVNQDLIASLENLLLRARTGLLVAMAWTGITGEGKRDSGFDCEDSDQEPMLLGSIDMLYAEYRRAVSDE